ncbi:MAG: hypothetical protein IT368_04515 [Candidatus Hydrogenedentes bacterium]|nr:hypothetical protein [Candidatus Hydrogenedentota bacterium]
MRRKKADTVDTVHVYVPPGDTWLVERAIAAKRNVPHQPSPYAGREQESSCPPFTEEKKGAPPAIQLVAAPENVEQAQALAKSIDGPQPILHAVSQRIVLPLSFPQVLLQFRHPNAMPDLASAYPLIRKFWQQGVREFEIFGLGGSFTVHVPMILDALADRHKGKRCFVVGNGPSLNQLDMSLLRNDVVLGSNQVYLGYDNWGFSFPYWGVYDDYQIQAYGADYEQRVPQDCTQFFPVPYLPLLHFANGCPINTVFPRSAPRGFSDTPERVFRGFTVTYMLLQIAAIMGCDPIILVGVDHRYNLQRRYIRSKALRMLRRGIVRRLRGGPIYDAALAASQAWKRHQNGGEASLWEADHAAGPTHFTEAYTDPQTRRFLPPEPEEAERDFTCAARWAAEKGAGILNATPDSALNAFERVDFKSLF